MRYIFALAMLFTLATFYQFVKAPGEMPPQMILKLSTFESPDQIGAFVFRRYINEIREAPVIVLGSAEDLLENDLIWKGFMAVANEFGIHFKTIYAEAGLKDILVVEGPERLIFDSNVPPHIAPIVGQKLIFNIRASDKNTGWVQSLPERSLVFYQALMPTTEQDERQLRAHCDLQQKQFQVSCAGLQALDSKSKKRLEGDKWSAVVEKFFGRFNMIFVQPKSVESEVK